MYLRARHNREPARGIAPCSRRPRNSLPIAFRLSHFCSSSVIFGSFSYQLVSNSVTFPRASSYEKLQNVTECDSFVGFPLYRTALHRPQSASARPLSRWERAKANACPDTVPSLTKWSLEGSPRRGERGLAERQRPLRIPHTINGGCASSHTLSAHRGRGDCCVAGARTKERPKTRERDLKFL